MQPFIVTYLKSMITFILPTINYRIKKNKKNGTEQNDTVEYLTPKVYFCRKCPDQKFRVIRGM